jgi:acyl carrier protein
MTRKERVTQEVFRAIDEVNANLPEGRQLEKSTDTVLFGERGELDSLGLVSLIVATELQVEEAFGVSITIADEKAMSQERSPFKTIASLVDYVDSLLP